MGREERGVGGPEQGAVGVAHEGEPGVPQGGPDAVEVAGRVDGAHVGQDAAAARWAAAVVGTGSMSGPLEPGGAEPDPGALHATGLLRPTPRGSNETMSKRSRTSGVSTDSSLGRSSMPDPPGPPGLMTRDPIRSAGASAGWRATAIWMTVPPGWA